MKKILLLGLALVMSTLLFAPATLAQGSLKSGPDPATIRDPDLEKDSLHNLDVARQYFKLKKAYVASLKRCEEIYAGNPNFAKLDEILFIAGESSLRLAESKGKQKAKEKKPEEFREDARNYLSQLYNDFPDSVFRKQAEEDLKALGGPKPKEGKQ